MGAADAAWALSAGGFALAMSATPGPNNAMLAASGATFGMPRSLPHILGVSVGFPVMFAAVALGAGEAFQANPVLSRALHWIGAAYLLWLAWHVATARPGTRADGAARARPLRSPHATYPPSRSAARGRSDPVSRRSISGRGPRNPPTGRP